MPADHGFEPAAHATSNKHSRSAVLPLIRNLRFADLIPSPTASYLANFASPPERAASSALSASCGSISRPCTSSAAAARTAST